MRGYEPEDPPELVWLPSDRLSPSVVTPRVGELIGIASKLSDEEGSVLGFNAAAGEYLKAMIDSSIQVLQKAHPGDKIGSASRKEMLRLGIPFSLVHLLQNIENHLGCSFSGPPRSKEEELWRAADRGDLSIVQELCEDPSGVDVNCKFRYTTPLSIACIRDHREVVKYLLGHPQVDPNIPEEDSSPLYEAIKLERLEVVTMLLDHPRIKVVDFKESYFLEMAHHLLPKELFVKVLCHPNSCFEDCDPFDFVFSARFDTESEKEEKRVALELLLANPNFDVNQNFAFQRAIDDNQPDWVIEMFLAHPKFDVNLHRPFHKACMARNLQIVEYLLADSRTNLYLKDREDSKSPFFAACSLGALPIVKRLLSFGIIVDFEERFLSPYSLDLTLIDLSDDGSDVGNLLKEYHGDPVGTRARIRADFASQLFVMVVLICDGYFEIGQLETRGDVGRGDDGEAEKPRPRRIGEWEKKRKRFFRIAQKLPMELQMILCHRVYESPGDSIPSTAFESAFHSLGLSRTDVNEEMEDMYP